MQDESPKRRVSARGAARRQLLASRALQILGEHGLHALSHRAVDIALELPAGSCSFYYGTRLALVNAAADRLFAILRHDLTSHQDASGRIDVLALMRHWTTPQSRPILLARLELSLTSLRDAGIRERLAVHRKFFLEIAESTLAQKDVTDAPRAARDLLAMLDGELLRVAMTGGNEPYVPSEPLSRELSRYR